MKDNRFRNFSTILYPDSVPDDWLQIIDSWQIQAILSPLHDKDYNPDGELKKPHYHLMILFDGKKSDDQAKELIDQVNGVGLQRVNSIRGSARYFCHMDNPEKYRYDEKEVRTFCGIDYFEICSLSSDEYAAIREMIEFIKSNQVLYFCQLADYAASYREDWHRMLVHKCTVYLREYIKSYAYYIKNPIVIDPDS